MRWSFRTNGNYVDFVHTDETSEAVESTIFHLHNTSRCVSWSLSSDTTRINFTIDEVKYSNILITDIDFDGTAMNSQDDFETGITGMFAGLASSPGGDSGLETVTIELDDDDIKALGGTPVQIVAAVAGKIYIPATALLQLDTSGGTYGNVNNSQLALSVNGFWLAKTHTSTGLEEAGGIYQHTMPPFNEDGDATGLDGAALVLESPNGGAFTNGNAANTLKITVVYKEVDA